MPEMTMVVRWPDGHVQECYSPSLVLHDHLEAGASYSVADFVSRTVYALGIASERCLRDYYRLGPAEGRAAIAELVEAGELTAMGVAGWDKPAYLWHEAARPRRAAGQALLAPFDPLVWQRERVEALFGLRIRLEIYTPAHRRQHGYYVLPFLLGERIAARLDLKADRQANVLRVLAAHGEPGADPGETATALAAELALMARWLGLGGVSVAERGNLAPALRRLDGS